MTGPRIGSLFSGYGGLDLAVQSVYPDASHAWFCEFDAAPSKVLARHWPDVPNLEDVTAVDWTTVEPVDILTGGFPCQDVSVAGRRAGMVDGTRSGLWSHMAHAIDVLRPSLVVIENVGGLFSARAASVVDSHPVCLGDGGTGEHTVFLRALDAVLSTLSELGYDAQWTSLRAADVGAPHGRLRVFITAHPSGGGSGGRAALPLAGEAGESNASPHRADARPVPPRPTPRLMPTPRALDSTGVRGVTENRTDEANARAGLTLTDVAQLLPTPVSHPSGNTPEEHLRKKPGRAVVSDLSIIAEHGLFETGGTLLPTPTVNDMGASYTPEQWDEWTDRMRAEHGNGNGHGKSLSIEAQRLLPTPEAKLARSGPDYARAARAGSGGDDLATSTARLLPTPMVGSTSPAAHGQISGDYRRRMDEALALMPTPRATDGTKGGPNQHGSSGDLMLPSAVQPERFGPYAAAIHRWEHIIGRTAPAPTEPGKNRPRLAARFVEWMMGLPDGHVTDTPGLTRNQHLKALGNGVVPQQGAAALAHLATIGAQQ